MKVERGDPIALIVHATSVHDDHVGEGKFYSIKWIFLKSAKEYGQKIDSNRK